MRYSGTVHRSGATPVVPLRAAVGSDFDDPGDTSGDTHSSETKKPRNLRGFNSGVDGTRMRTK